MKHAQFPLKLARTYAVHKVRGLSLNNGVKSFDLERRKSFNQGQMYVALIRITKRH